MCLPCPSQAQDTPGTGEAIAQPQTGARLPWDYPLPPLDYMLRPTGTPPNGKPADRRSGLTPTFALAQEAAQTALEACQKDGLSVGVVVLDASGDLRYAIAAPDMPPGRLYIATRKGLGAIEFGVPTSQILAQLKADPEKVKRMKPYMAAFPGGIPLIKDGRTYGAVAASGAKADQDEHCASVGAARIMARL